MMDIQPADRLRLGDDDDDDDDGPFSTKESYFALASPTRNVPDLSPVQILKPFMIPAMGASFNARILPTSPSAQTRIKTNGSLLKIRHDSKDDSILSFSAATRQQTSWTLPRVNHCNSTSMEKDWQTLPKRLEKSGTDEASIKIVDICGKLKELEMEEEELLLEFEIEKALIKSLSPVPDDLFEKQKRLEKFEEQLVEYQRQLITLRGLDIDGSHGAQIADLEESYEQKRKEYDDLEYEILEMKAMREGNENDFFEAGEVITNRTALLESMEQEARRYQHMLQQERAKLLVKAATKDKESVRISSSNGPEKGDNCPAEDSATIPDSSLASVTSSDLSQRVSFRCPEDVGSSERRLKKLNRPMTCYLPQKGVDFNLLAHLDSCGHRLASVKDKPHLTALSCSGYLLKKSRRTRPHLWRRRWFVFDRFTKELFYRKRRSDFKVDGRFAFEDLQDVYVAHDAAGDGRTFCVMFVDGSKLFLKASSLCAMRIWVDCLITGTEGADSLFNECNAAC